MASFRQRYKTVKDNAQFEPISFDLDTLSTREEQQWRQQQRLGSPFRSRVGRLGLSPRPQEKFGLPSASLPTALPYPAPQSAQFLHSSEVGSCGRLGLSTVRKHEHKESLAIRHYIFGPRDCVHHHHGQQFIQ